MTPRHPRSLDRGQRWNAAERRLDVADFGHPGQEAIDRCRHPDGSPSSLIAAAVAGDERAFAMIVDRHRVAMVRVAFVVCGDANLAEEAVQAAWPIAWRRLGSLRDPDRLGAWLASVAVNEARQLIRRRQRRSVVEISVATHERATAPDPSTSVGDIDLARAMANLEPEDRAILALR